MGRDYGIRSRVRQNRGTSLRRQVGRGIKRSGPAMPDLRGESLTSIVGIRPLLRAIKPSDEPRLQRPGLVTKAMAQARCERRGPSTHAGSGRQSHGEDRAAGEMVGHRHPVAMSLDPRLDDAETEPEAALRAAVVAAIETPPGSSLFLRRNAGAATAEVHAQTFTSLHGNDEPCSARPGRCRLLEPDMLRFLLSPGLPPFVAILTIHAAFKSSQTKRHSGFGRSGAGGEAVCPLYARRRRLITGRAKRLMPRSRNVVPPSGAGGGSVSVSLSSTPLLS